MKELMKTIEFELFHHWHALHLYQGFEKGFGVIKLIKNLKFQEHWAVLEVKIYSHRQFCAKWF